MRSSSAPGRAPAVWTASPTKAFPGDVPADGAVIGAAELPDDELLDTSRANIAERKGFRRRLSVPVRRRQLT